MQDQTLQLETLTVRATAHICEVTLSLMKRSYAPRGTATLLVVEPLAKLKAEGVAWLPWKHSPLLPMTGRRGEDRTVIVRALRLASQRLGAFYSFEGLRRFKGKFVPIWWESE